MRSSIKRKVRLVLLNSVGCTRECEKSRVKIIMNETWFGTGLICFYLLQTGVS